MNNYQQNNPVEDDLIERFLLEQLSDEEARAFDKRLSGDPAFRQEVEERKLISVAIQESELRNRLEDYHNNVRGSVPRLPQIKRWLIASAVIALILLPVAWFLFRPSESGRLYTKYYKPDPGLITAMATKDASDYQYKFEKAMIDYKTGDYQSALTGWTELDRSADSDTLDYFIGSAYLALKQPAPAINYFRKVDSRPQSVFKGEACWYAGLALLQTGQSAEALTYLRRSTHKDKDSLIRKLEE